MHQLSLAKEKLCKPRPKEYNYMDFSIGYSSFKFNIFLQQTRELAAGNLVFRAGCNQRQS